MSQRLLVYFLIKQRYVFRSSNQFRRDAKAHYKDESTGLKLTHLYTNELFGRVIAIRQSGFGS